ncbi:MAG: 4Fe-4S binding protein [Methanothrix sp.]|nr:4Fe-4S binding protein [Methanothrix sp.]
MRKIIKIDQSLCNGCGECITACAEGAIELKDGKARVVSDSFCDGLGACLAVCREGALTIEERETLQFDEKAAKEHKHHARGADAVADVTPCTLPITLKQYPKTPASHGHEMTKSGVAGENELIGWPIQMRLVRPWAPYLKGARLLVAGDCTAFAYPAIQQDFIKGRVALVGCPKLDDAAPFVDKLSEILKANEIRDIAVLHMTVPCCAQLQGLVAEAVLQSGKDVPQKSYVVGIDGKLNQE